MNKRTNDYCDERVRLGQRFSNETRPFLEMIHAECRVHLLPNAVGKGRLAIFREACEKFSLECVTPFDAERVHCVLVEDALETQVVLEKILHLDPFSSSAPQLVSTRWLSESLRAQQLLPREPFIRTHVFEPTLKPSEEATSIDREQVRTKTSHEQSFMPRVRSDSGSDYDDDGEETNGTDQELAVRRVELRLQRAFFSFRHWQPRR